MRVRAPSALRGSYRGFARGTLLFGLTPPASAGDPRGLLRYKTPLAWYDVAGRWKRGQATYEMTYLVMRGRFIQVAPPPPGCHVAAAARPLHAALAARGRV